MAGISFADSADSVWIVAGWAFRQVLEDLRRESSVNRELLEAITEAEHLGFLHVELLPPTLRTELTGALERICHGVLDGSYRSGIEGRFADIETRDAYREGIQLLVTAIQAGKQRESGNPGVRNVP